VALPRISIVTPSFNQARYLEATIRSVLDQGYPDLEYIVIDGGSTDGSVDIIRRYADRLSYWVSEPDAGQSAAVGKGFRHATGEVLGWLNSDDILLPHALETVGKAFADARGVGLIYGARRVIDEDGRVIGSYRPPSLLHKYYFAFGQWIPQECAFWRRELFDRAGGIDESMFFALDLSLFIRMWKVGRFKRIDAELGAFRTHPESKSSKHGDVMYSEAEKLRRRHGIPHFQSRIVNRLGQRLIYAQATVEKLVKGALRATGRRENQPMNRDVY
jgi:glycosyltransferase involved in cell wall biosynthesis